MDKIFWKNLQNKKIAALGLGVENLALVKFLIKNTSPRPLLGKERGARKNIEERDLHITVCDPKSAAELGDRFIEIKQLARKNKLPEINLMTGKNYDAHLADFDIVFRSPGYPLFNPNLAKAKKAGVKITSAMELFFEICQTKNIIGVTGSKGKGTVSSLIYEILTTPSPSLKRRGVFLGGNIGTAPFEFIDKIKPNDFVVLELSSFQLEDLQVSPHIAVVTNLFKEHLASADPNNPNYHQTMKSYWLAKANIFTHQKKNDWIVANGSLEEKILSFCHSEPRARNLLQSMSDVEIFSKNKFRSAQDVSRSLAAARDDKKNRAVCENKIVFYDKSDLKSNLIGEHNKENIAAAIAVAKILKIKPETIKKAVKKFRGLPHRTEFVAEIDGVRYFDDSFATVPDVSVIALKAVTQNSPTPSNSPSGRGRVILLAGGADKGSNFKNFAREIKKRVKILILFKGKGTERLKKELRVTGYELRVVDNMKDAVVLAKKNSNPGDIVLLSAGCASFGCFKNYKERGDQFKSEVKSQK
jgi:UDP-N-acetylmuramoylalanine--D-glutamate ligase